MSETGFLPHEQRVIDERIELFLKINKLNDFINGSSIFKTLDRQDSLLLTYQLDLMQMYLEVLDRRIELFTK